MTARDGREAVNCIVTAGPTYEPLDQVRRLTNFSTGRLGSELAKYLVAHGHRVHLLKGYYSVYKDMPAEAIAFTTTNDLRERLKSMVAWQVDAVFHAAAVSDFQFGQVFSRDELGNLRPLTSGKFSTRYGPLLAELLPTAKIIAELRGWFPQARLVGWKYEVDEDRAHTIAAAIKQLQSCRTDACVVNGPAYGDGFGVVTPDSQCRHVPDETGLFHLLAALIRPGGV